MEADTIRLILIVVGVAAILALFFWERSRDRDEDDEEDYEDDEPRYVGRDKREPNLGELDKHAEKIDAVKVSDDKKKVSLAIKGFKPGRIYELRLDGVKSAEGDPVLHPEAYYTVNELP